MHNSDEIFLFGNDERTNVRNIRPLKTENYRSSLVFVHDICVHNFKTISNDGNKRLKEKLLIISIKHKLNFSIFWHT